MVWPNGVNGSILGAALALALVHGTAIGKKEKVEVTLSAPALASAPATITLTATALVKLGNHAIAKVEFFHAQDLIGTSTAPVTGNQYAYQWTAVPAGTYSVTAKATTDKGDADVSDPVHIIVNAPPSAVITQPAPDTIFPAPAAVTIAASATDTDGTIAKVDFYAGVALIGTVTRAPYSIDWLNVSSGSYDLTAVVTDNHGAITTSQAVTIRVNAAPALALTSPPSNASFTAPANITLTADASDSDGSITRVDFFSGDTLIATTTSAPHSFVWSGVLQGTYHLSARATDDSGTTTTSTPVTVTVAGGTARLYFIHVDHLNTPRLVADATGTTVWRWDQQEPFGNNAPDENPSGLGAFDLPLRLPGQYFDREANLHYNYFRSYDPSIGRYGKSDPLGLIAGVNTYVYGDGEPLRLIDRFGLEPGNLTQRGYPQPARKSICGADDGRKYPMDFGGWSFETPCRNHDNCYSVCRKPRSTCDDEFFADAMRECSRIPVWIAIIMRQGASCQTTATEYYWALKIGGEDAYRIAQAQCKGC